MGTDQLYTTSQLPTCVDPDATVGLLLVHEKAVQFSSIGMDAGRSESQRPRAVQRDRYR